MGQQVDKLAAATRPIARVGIARVGAALLLLVPLLVLAGGTAGATNPTPLASAFGANAFGELGNGTTTDSSTPVAVSNLSGEVVLSAAGRHSLAIMGDGTVEAWGRNAVGELGNNTTTGSSTPVPVFGLGQNSGVVAVAGNAPPISTTSVSGDGHSMALKADGTVRTWGNNQSGELGIGLATGPSTCGTSTPCSLVPRTVTGVSSVSSIAAGGSFDLALRSDGTVWSWGNNTSGELGIGTTSPNTCGTTTPCSVSPRRITALSGVSAIAAGASFGVALKSGTVWTWGNNASGQLGNGTTGTDVATPHQVPSLSGVTQVTAGAAFVIAVKSDGSVVAWGNGTSGELGNGGTTDLASPHAVSGLGAGSGVVSVTAGFSHALALKSDGTVVAWGHDKSGQLGDGTTLPGPDVLTPITLTGVTAAQVSAGGSHTLISQAPLVVAKPRSRPPGTSITASGFGFSPGETVDVVYETRLASPASQPLCSGVVASDATVSCTGTVPTSNVGPLGAHTLLATGATSGLQGAATMMLAPPTLTVAPATGVRGSSVTITGSHFAPTESVSVVWLTKLASPTTVTMCSPNTSAAGAFSCTATIPTTTAGPLGAHTIRATGAVSMVPGSASFMLVPKVAVTPTSGPKGTHVTITGANFTNGEKIAVVWLTKLASPATIALCSPTASSTGTFSCGATIPSTNAGPLGAHTIRATGATSKVPGTTTFTLK